MDNKIVYIITTYKCSSCKLMEYILKDILKDNPNFSISVHDFNEAPEWLKTNVTMTDFPTVIFTENNTIKYHFTGTKSKQKILCIIDDINY